LWGRKKTFWAHFAVVEDVVLLGSSRKPIFHYFQLHIYDRLSGAFCSSKAGFQSLVFVWDSWATKLQGSPNKHPLSNKKILSRESAKKKEFCLGLNKKGQ
jgi:hypothetical protein